MQVKGRVYWEYRNSRETSVACEYCGCSQVIQVTKMVTTPWRRPLYQITFQFNAGAFSIHLNTFFLNTSVNVLYNIYCIQWWLLRTDKDGNHPMKKIIIDTMEFVTTHTLGQRPFSFDHRRLAPCYLSKHYFFSSFKKTVKFVCKKTPIS